MLCFAPVAGARARAVKNVPHGPPSEILISPRQFLLLADAGIPMGRVVTYKRIESIQKYSTPLASTKSRMAPTGPRLERARV